MYGTFDLVLMVNHACNLRCAYCYTGAKFWRSMPEQIARRCVERAVASLETGGTLELGFFGGEPLLEPELILKTADFAACLACEADLELDLSLTTNGTLTCGDAWRVLTMPAMRVTVSHDGLPAVHDKYRHRGSAGNNPIGSALQVLETMQSLIAAGKDVRASMVVRPDTVAWLPDGIAWLRRHGIDHVDPTLDLWTRWTAADAESLLTAVVRCADLWHEGLPDCSIGWFDQKALRLTRAPANSTARCSYGDGQIAVAPSGNLYPCERVIGADENGNPTRLPGHALADGPFHPHPAHGRSAEECATCLIQSQCNTYCRCSNFIRTGDPTRPDGLLCLLDQAVYRETARVLRSLERTSQPPLKKEIYDERLPQPT